MNPLYRGSSHQLLSDRTIGDGGHPQFALKTSVTGAIALAGIFVPVSTFGAFPNTGAMQTTAIQSALTNAGPGVTVAFDAGEYLIDNDLFPPSHLGIFLSPGTVIKQTSALTVFNHVGTLSATAATTTLGDVTEGIYQFQVVTTAGLSAGQWLRISDSKPISGGASRLHMELVQIDSIEAGNVIVLKHPVLDTYTFALAAQVRGVSPVEEVTIWGQGAVTNPSDAANEGKCLRYEYSVNCTVQDIEIYEFGLEAVGYIKSAHCLTTGTRIHDGTRFNSQQPPTPGTGFGYGITCTESNNLLWDRNRIFRTRHALDISWMSQMVAVNGNVVKAQASTAIQTHPDTRGTIICNNLIDGVVGYDTSGLEFGGEEGSGIGIRENCDGATIANNTLLNIYGSGITVHHDDNQDIKIVNNVLDGVNLDNSFNHAGIRVYGTGTSVDCPGLEVSGNTVTNFLRCGIMVGYNEAKIDNNTIRNTNGAAFGIAVQSRLAGLSINNVALTRNKIHGGTFGIMLGGDSASVATAGRLINNTKVEGNEIYDTTNEGIGHAVDSLQHYSTGGSVKNNKIVRCNTGASAARAGILLIDSATIAPTLFKYVVDNNEVVGGKNGIRVVGDGSKILRNDVHNMTVANSIGIYVACDIGASVADDILVQGNAVYDVTLDGIRVGGDAGGANNVRVFENQLNDNGGYGLRIESDATETIVRGLEARGNVTAPYIDSGTTTRFLGGVNDGFIISGDAQQNLIFTDPANDRVGIATDTPATTLEVRGETLVASDSSAAFEVQTDGGTPVFTVDADGTNGALLDGDLAVTGFSAMNDGEFTGSWLVHGAGATQKLAVLKVGPGNQIFAIDTSNDRVEISGAKTILRTAVAASPYNIVARDCHLSVSTAAARTINLPAANATTAGHGRHIIIKDAVGAGAATNNITIVPAGADTIDQVAANLVLAADRASVTLASDGTSNWEVL